MMANTWQGEFPWQNLLHRRVRGHLAGRPFPANGYGLYDMTGNVWEWTCDYFTPRHPARGRALLRAAQPAGGAPRPAASLAGPASPSPRRVIKGGSHLCAPNYCLRYRPAARQGEAIDTATCHLGFRCVVRGTSPAGQ